LEGTAEMEIMVLARGLEHIEDKLVLPEGMLEHIEDRRVVLAEGMLEHIVDREQDLARNMENTWYQQESRCSYHSRVNKIK